MSAPSEVSLMMTELFVDNSEECLSLRIIFTGSSIQYAMMCCDSGSLLIALIIVNRPYETRHVNTVFKVVTFNLPPKSVNAI